MRFALVVVFAIIFHNTLLSQESSRGFERVVTFPSRFLQNLNSSANKYEQKLASSTEKFLLRLQRQEARLKKRIFSKDSTLANSVFLNVDSIYGELITRANQKVYSTNPRNDQYVAFLDTLRTSLRFLEENPNTLNSISPDQLKSTLAQIQSLQGKLNQTEEIKRFIQERRNYLKNQLWQSQLGKDFKKLEQEIFYYEKRILDFKNDLNDPRKLEAYAIRLLQKIPAVSDFLSKHSELASLFRMPNSGGNSSAPLNVQGLQTRSAVLQQIQQSLGTGIDPNQFIQQSGFGPETELKQLKDKIAQLGGGGSTDAAIPAYKSRTGRTRSIWRRIEIGANVQSVKGNYYFPVTTDLALNVAYSINSKSSTGVAVAYKAGLGTGWNNIRLSHQGLGFRTYVELKAKGSFWLYGGAEMNYREEIRRVDVLKNYSAYQKSGLVGISKKYRINKRLSGNMQLLYDFLYAQQIPRGSPLLFRVGYAFSKK